MCSFFVTHDDEILEYLDTEMKEEYRIKYMPVINNIKGEENMRHLFINFSNKFRENGCLATLRYKVKKAVPITRLYTDTVTYGNAADSKYVFLFDNEGAQVDWSDVYTVNIEDNASSSFLTLSTIPAQGNEEVTVPISIEQNDGFNLLGMEIDYDTSLFTYGSLEIDDSLRSKISLDSVYEFPGSGRIKASFIALEDITDIGDFLKLKLRVKDGVLAGTTSNVEVEITQVGNKAETSMSGTGTTCAVSITDTTGGEEQQPVLGDVNAGKKIDLVDAVYILQNYNQVREFTRIQETAADVDKNGTINLVDALMIMKYFNGEIHAF